MTEVIVRLPDDVATTLRLRGEDASRRLLEAFVVERCKAGELTSFQVAQILGFETPMEVDAFLKARGVYRDYSEEDFLRDEETSQYLAQTRQ